MTCDLCNWILYVADKSADCDQCGGLSLSDHPTFDVFRYYNKELLVLVSTATCVVTCIYRNVYL